MRSPSLVTLLLLVAHAICAPAPKEHDTDHSETVKASQSIQDAINKAKPGDKIIVEKGIYAEQLEITTSDITLIGKPGAILIAPQNYTPNFCTGLNYDFSGAPTDAGICVHGKGVKLAEFKQEHRKVESVDKYIRNVQITGFEVHSFSGMNIVLYAGIDCVFANNKLVDGGQYGLLTVYSINTLARNNMVTSITPFPNYIAMCMDDQSGAKFIGNDISGYIIALCTQTSGGLVKGNTVKSCCIGPFVDPGVNGAKLLKNTITSRNPACPDEAAAGIILSGSINTLVDRNTIQFINSKDKKAVGLYLTDDETTGSKVSGNTIEKNYFKGNDVDIVNNSTIKPDTNIFKGNVCKSAFTAAGPTSYCGRF
jgi:hypothetical protein